MQVSRNMDSDVLEPQGSWVSLPTISGPHYAFNVDKYVGDQVVAIMRGKNAVHINKLSVLLEITCFNV